MLAEIQINDFTALEIMVLRDYWPINEERYLKCRARMIMERVIILSDHLGHENFSMNFSMRRKINKSGQFFNRILPYKGVL